MFNPTADESFRIYRSLLRGIISRTCPLDWRWIEAVQRRRTRFRWWLQPWRTGCRNWKLLPAKPLRNEYGNSQASILGVYFRMAETSHRQQKRFHQRMHASRKSCEIYPRWTWIKRGVNSWNCYIASTERHLDFDIWLDNEIHFGNN